MNRADVIEQTAAEVQRRLADQGAGHGWDHVVRVRRAALAIQEEAGGDRFVIELAALLHDVGDAKFHDGEEQSGAFSREILDKLGVAADIIDQVVHIVDNLSFRKSDRADSLATEGQVVQDADRLDALGAIGIVRTIEYGAFTGQPFHAPEDPQAKTGIGHFHEKLFKLRGLMNTETGRRLAIERECFMHRFLEQFLDEWGDAVAPR